MTTFQFTPSSTTPFQFQPTLDGNEYTAIITWNVYGQRWYINLLALDGTRIFTMPVIGSQSAPHRGVSLTAGYFTSRMVFRQADQTFEVTP